MRQAFILTATDRWPLLVNRFDAKHVGANQVEGVAGDLLETGSYNPVEGDMVAGILQLRRDYYGPGVIAVDGGAHIGVFTVDWAKTIQDYGKVVAIEPQERIYYALCGNVTLNNCFNAACIHAALSDKVGVMDMPVPDYCNYANFGGLSLTGENTGLGQDTVDIAPVRTLTVDSLGLDRCDFLKLDVEGMELHALAGAKQTIIDYHPVISVEHIHVGEAALREHLEQLDYRVFRFGMNLLGAHRLDKVMDHIAHTHRMMTKAIIMQERAA